MVTRYATTNDLAGALRASPGVPDYGLRGFLAVSTSMELVVMSSTSTTELLPTYEVRLKRFLDGDGPRVDGLESFVEALRQERRLRIFSLESPDLTWIGLASPEDPPQILRVTAVHQAR